MFLMKIKIQTDNKIQTFPKGLTYMSKPFDSQAHTNQDAKAK